MLRVAPELPFSLGFLAVGLNIRKWYSGLHRRSKDERPERRFWEGVFGSEPGGWLERFRKWLIERMLAPNTVARHVAGGTWTNVPGAGRRMGVGGRDSMQDANAPPRGPYYRLKVELP